MFAVQKTPKWRVVDIVVAAVLGVACGLVFVFWNGAGEAFEGVLSAIAPPIKGFAGGVWLAGGVLGALIIRKPGAAIFVEVVAASISAAIGNHFGLATVVTGLAQGLGAELIFLLFAYRSWGWATSALAGALAAVGGWLTYLWLYAYAAKGFGYNVLYLAAFMLSGAIVGVLCWLLVKALAQTGALDRFASGREAKREV